MRDKLVQFTRYFVVAATAYIIDFVGYIFLIYLLFDPIISNLIIKIFAALAGYYLHKNFTFKIKNSKNLTTAGKYFGSLLLYVPLSSFLLYIHLFFFNPVISKVLADFLLFFGTYILSAKFIFNEK